MFWPAAVRKGALGSGYKNEAFTKEAENFSLDSPAT